MTTKTILSKLRLSGQDLITKWTPGESRKLRVIEPDIYTVRRHWVEVQTDTGEPKRTPIPCLGEACDRVVLPTGETLHHLELDEEHRVLVWSHELGELRILSGKKQIFRRLQELEEEFGDIAKFDIVIKCVAQSGLGGRKYEISAVPTGAHELSAEIKRQIDLERTEELKAILNPKPMTIAEVLAKLPGAKALPAVDDEGPAGSDAAWDSV